MITANTITAPEGDRVFFSEGACPYLTCFRLRAHAHPICPACRAVWYGNAFCETCRAHPREPWEHDDPV